MKNNIDDLKQSKVKVLLVHNYYQIPGGEDTVVANEKKLLEDHGHEVILYSRKNSELTSFSLIRKLLLPITTIFNLKTYCDVKKIINEQKIDVVHVHNTLNLISPSVYYAAISCGVPVVQTIHNFRLLCPGATFYRNGHICEDCVEYGLQCAIKYRCYRNNRLQTLGCVINTWIHRSLGVYGKINYICLTEFNKEKILQLKQIKPEKVFIKPNFLDSAENIISYIKRPNQYIYAGRLDKLKGVDILFEAWKRMGKVAPKLRVCGTGPLENWCKEFIQKNPDCAIEMLGHVPNKEVKELIANSKALILPTQWYEGFPMSILEAYSVGTPVIGSDIGNVASLIEENVTGWKFHYDSVDSLMEKVLNNGDFQTVQLHESYKSNYAYKTLSRIYAETIKNEKFKI